MSNNKTAIITGASRGIGKAIALELAKNGYNTAVIYNGNAEKAAKVCEEVKALGVKAEAYKCDVSSLDECTKLCEKFAADFGGYDVLVNNAGITRDSLILNMHEEDFDAVIAANLKGAFNMIKSTARHLIRKRAGRIINISSVSGMMGNPGQANYSASKAGIIGLTKTVAKELAPRGITCNAIAPGFIKTDMTANLPDSAMEAAKKSIPLKRIGDPADIAALAAFLASDAASYITGEVIKVDGGLYI